MKNVLTVSYLVLALAIGIVVVTGCNQTAENATTATDTNVSETSVAAKTDGGCCGKCATEQVAAGQAEGCCGKCSGEGETAAKSEGCGGKCAGDGSVSAKTEGCCGEKSAVAAKTDGGCGKCAGETANAPTATNGKTITCENGCNACAEGDSTNCKCGDGSGEGANSSPRKNSETDVDAHVNTMPEDRDIFHYLLENHGKITRTVTELDNGVKTITESTDAAVTAKIQEHVASMYKRVEDGRPLRMWDELYREIFKHADKIEMQIENTENGIAVTETSDDEYVIKLIQSHAIVVSGFAKRGFEEARENHEPPKK